jgi:hypothetical protein
MFDDAAGHLDASAAMWKLIGERDSGKFAEVQLEGMLADGTPRTAPLEPANQIDKLPYLPDPLARAAAIRDLPGTQDRSIGRVEPGDDPESPVQFARVDTENPRPGSVTLIDFGGRDDWQHVRPFRIALADGDGPPRWDPVASLLTVSLPKATNVVVPLSACCEAVDLKLLGIWQWLMEYIDYRSTNKVDAAYYERFELKDQITHIIQYAQEGAHWMLTPPHLLTLVHAVQQPLGRPGFTPLRAQFGGRLASLVRTEPEAEPTTSTELDTVTAWRERNGSDALLIGALHIHGASTAKIDLVADWQDWVDDGESPRLQPSSSHVDELPLQALTSGYVTGSNGNQTLGWYDATHDLLCFAPAGSRLGSLESGLSIDVDAAPTHRLGDTRHHRIRYSAVASSRYREYFPQEGTDFTRTSDPVTVDVPASAPPAAPVVLYVIPAFGWQRDNRTNQQRSVRVGGGLRIYLSRPWFSSGDGELLGISLASSPINDREQAKAYLTQWGQDPIWDHVPLSADPSIKHFPDAQTVERSLPLSIASGVVRVDVAGYPVHFDEERHLWYCDLTIVTESSTYAPFVRLALVRYQPNALVEAKLSRAVVADFVQLTPERAATLAAAPGESGVLRVTVSGPAPYGPTSNELVVTVQKRDPGINTDMAWKDSNDFSVSKDLAGPLHLPPPADFLLWSGVLRYIGKPADLAPGRYRLLLREYERLSGDGANNGEESVVQRRLIYAETFTFDHALLDAPPVVAARTTVT